MSDLRNFARGVKCTLRLTLLAAASAVIPAHNVRAAAQANPELSSSEHAPGDLTALPLEALMQVTVSSASRLAQPISDAPAAVFILTAADIRDFGWKTLADALASLPGLYTTYDRTYSYLGARGFQRPGDYNSRFLLLIDGVRTNDSVFDQAAIGTDFPVDLDLVERIEYAPGPGSAVYGSNALFGVVNVITKTGESLRGAQVAVAAGSFGEKQARATYGWHGTNGADVLLSASSFVSNGQSLFYPEFDTPDQNKGVAQGLDYDRSQKLLAKFTYGEFGLSMGYGNRTKGVPTAPYGAIFNAPFSTTDTHSFIDGTFEHTIAEGIQLASSAYWGRYDYRSPSLYAPGPVENVDGDHALWYGADVHTTFTSLPKNRVVLGFDYTRDAHRDQYNFNVEPYESFLDDRRSGNRTGIYGEDELQLPANFSLNVGLRYDVETAAGGNVSPRVALAYKPTSSDTVKLVYGRAYRAPNAYELYYAVPGVGGQSANPSLKAEHITTTELIYQRQFGATGRATLSLFHYDIRDLISETTSPAGLYVFENLDRAKANGAEISYEQRFGETRVRASYSWQIARDGATGDILQNSPRHLAKLNLVLPLFGNAARLATELRCVSSRLAESGHAAGYCLGNLSVGSTRLIQHADVSFSVYNVANTQYADPAGPGYTQEVIAQQSRTFLVKMVYGF
ncbi:TonB-dependent receptor [Paraburkholderia sp. RL17-383-BIF-A]|uniref:TonB-dependent receptor plug domain-containing protein n=1 Tax=Paraburkholderia sp. RL17-383-BIF-A TaxID=3031631 RepID=UPI0038BA5E6B